jgi:hypothetical protein
LKRTLSLYLKASSSATFPLILSVALLVSRPLLAAADTASGKPPLRSPEASKNAGKLAHKNGHILQGTVFQSELIDQLERLGITCAAHDSTLKSLAVNNVRLGSDAYYKGVTAGDEIKALQLKGSVLNILATRSGKLYRVQLEALTASSITPSSIKVANSQARNLSGSVNLLSPKVSELGRMQVPLADVANHNIPTVDVGQSKIPIAEIDRRNVPIVDVGTKVRPVIEIPPKAPKPEDVLRNYDVELIIDRTGSMSEIDGTGEQTKFEWCRDQVRNFVGLMWKYNHGINITVFNTDFHTFYNCTPGKVEQIYTEFTPEGRTDLVDPLMSRLNAIRGAQKKGGPPTLIAVIHDGLPNVPADPRAVNEALINFSRTLDDPNQILITFLQIGETFDGRDFCIDLDDNLVKEGAKYDFIDTCTFPELKKVGLAKALVEALEEKKTASSKNHGAAFTVHSDARNNLVKMLNSPESAKQLSDLDQTLKARQAERRRLVH